MVDEILFGGGEDEFCLVGLMGCDVLKEGVIDVYPVGFFDVTAFFYSCSEEGLLDIGLVGFALVLEYDASFY